MILLQFLVLAIVAFPVLAVVILSIADWAGHSWSEQSTTKIVGYLFSASIVASGCVAAWMLIHPHETIYVHLGTWFKQGHYQFQWRLVADHLAISFAGFSAVLVGLISIFSKRYLHKEPGFNRFYLLLTIFGASVELIALAGSLDLIFIGWEFVGITSALLIAFFHERAKPVEHGFRAFLTYRICDIGLLAAAVWLHHSTGSSALLTDEPWSGFAIPSQPHDATFVGLLLLWAAMGKAAQVPFGGWLPRAMEGPTPSSAIFYGAISIHLGPYLLLRAAPMLEHSAIATAAVIIVGSLTALHATLVGRTQTDIKSALAYASMTQVGLIFIEIGLGFRYLALVHMIGHACARSLQILRSPNLLRDHQHLQQAVGQQLPHTGGHFERWVPPKLQPWLYRYALQRGYMDAFLRDYIVGGFMYAATMLDRLEQAWIHWLAGEKLKSLTPPQDIHREIQP